MSHRALWIGWIALLTACESPAPSEDRRDTGNPDGQDTMECGSLPAPEDCGLNNRGEQAYRCVDGDVVLEPACSDPDVCEDGDRVDLGSCGPNRNGDAYDLCERGQWEAHCVDADECEDGSTRSGSTPCGLDGMRVEECVDGEWVMQHACASSSPDDSALTSDATRLPFRCLDEPLATSQEIIDRFPTGSSLYTPGVQGGLQAVGMRRLYRTCTDVTGCGDWYWTSTTEFVIGYSLDAAGNVFLFQQQQGGATLDLPVDSGETLATLWTRFDQERFLVTLTEGCFAFSTVVHVTDRGDGSWQEGVWGTAYDVDDVPIPRDPPAPLPDLTTDACPEPTGAMDVQAVALAWLGAGRTRRELDLEPVLAVERECTPYTGCTEWESVNAYDSSPMLVLANGQLHFESSRGNTPIQPDGTFVFNDASSGFITPECASTRTIALPEPGGLAGGTEVVEVRVGTP